jgi:ABC-2 type transport system permease protein
MIAALEFELLKARRSGVFRWGAIAVAVGVPLLATGFFLLARLDGGSSAAAKAQAMVTDDSLVGLVALGGQILSVAMLLTAGIAASWSFGREFVDDAAPALYAIATPRSSIARAKLVILLGWSLGTVVASVVLTLLAGWATGLPVDDAAMSMMLRAGAAGSLSAVLATPLALLASWRRGYLPGFVGLLGIVVATQVVTAIGGGAWFPYAAPSLWMGMGGPDATGLSAVQLLLPIVVALAAAIATTSWWHRAEAG